MARRGLTPISASSDANVRRTRTAVKQLALAVAEQLV
jgi:hypothetical protein